MPKPRFINTQLQLGVPNAPKLQNRFNGFSPGLLHPIYLK
jgi:hypothetical protein